MKKPTFFIVGAPKCGTTSLYLYLRDHPRIFMSPVKEPQYFAEDFLGDRRHTRNLADYLALFAGARDEDQIGEASTAYLGSKRAAEKIQTFAPDSRILIMLRNPVDKMYSRFNDARFNNREHHESLEAALAAEERYGPSFGLGYKGSARYVSQVRRYIDAFGREKVHVILFDDFRDNTAAAYERTLRFLDVRPDYRSDFPVMNRRQSVRSMRLQEFVRRPPQVLRRFGRRVLTLGMRKRLRGWFTSLNVVSAAPPPLSPDLRLRLQSEFEDEVNELSQLLGQDLSAWSSH